jgi:uncharacterized membrane protein
LGGPDWESVLGANWPAKLGIAALAVATGFFLKYAFEAGWIRPPARVAIGLCAAGILLGLGQYLLRRPLYRNYAQVLFSGGIIIFFLSIYAASNYYQLISVSLGFSLLAVAALAASALAAVNNTEAVALLCLLGGFLAPVLIHEQGVESGELLRFYVYLAGLNLWSAALARYSSWPSLTVVSFGATWLLFMGAGPGRRPDALTAEAFAAVFLAFSCYGSMATARQREQAGPQAGSLGVVMLIGGCAAFAVASARLLADVALLGLPALAIPGLLVAAVLAGMATVFPRLPGRDLPIRQALRYLSTVALLLLIGASVAAGPATPRTQAPGAFLFVLFTYLVFLGACLHMERQEGGVAPAIALLFANQAAHLVAAFRVLATVQFWGVHAAPLWLPLTSCLCLGTLWRASRSHPAPHHFRRALMLTSVATLLAPFFAAVQLHDSWPVGIATGLFLAEFAVVSAIWVALRRSTYVDGRQGDLWAAPANAIIFSLVLATVAGTTERRGLVLLAGCAVVLAAYHALVAAALLRRAEDRPLRRPLYLFLALTFGTIAIPLQFEGSAITVAWAIEAVLLVMVGLWRSTAWARWYGVMVLLLAAAKSVALDLDFSETLPLVLNQRMLSGAAVIAAAYLTSWLLSRARASLSEDEQSLPTILMLVGTAYAVIFPSMEVWALPTRLGAAAGRPSSQHFALSLFWGVFAASALAVGIRRRNHPLRSLALALLWLATAKALMADVWLTPAPFHPLANTRFLAGAAVIAALSISGWLLAQRQALVSAFEASLPAAMVVAAHTLALLFLTVDLWVYLETTFPLVGRLGAACALSVLWSIYSACALAAGLRSRNLPVRGFALVVLSLVTAKLIFMDMVVEPSRFRLFLNTRFLAAAAVIAATSAAAWLLSRKRSALSKPEAAVLPALVLAPNLLALIFISLDIWQHFATALPGAARANAQQLSLSIFWSVYALGGLSESGAALGLRVSSPWACSTWQSSRSLCSIWPSSSSPIASSPSSASASSCSSSASSTHASKQG